MIIYDSCHKNLTKKSESPGAHFFSLTKSDELVHLYAKETFSQRYCFPSKMSIFVTKVNMRMMTVPKFFNTAGPIKQEIHYNVDPLSRIDLEEIELLIQQGKYFILHAPDKPARLLACLPCVTI